MPIYRLEVVPRKRGTVMLIVHVMLVMAFVFILAILVKDVIDAHQAR